MSKRKFLFARGGDDKFVPEKDLKSFQDEMNGLKVDWQINIYSGAVHSFTNLVGPVTRRAVRHITKRRIRDLSKL